MKKNVLSLIALVTGLLALALAALPPVVLAEPGEISAANQQAEGERPKEAGGVDHSGQSPEGDTPKPSLKERIASAAKGAKESIERTQARWNERGQRAEAEKQATTRRSQRIRLGLRLGAVLGFLSLGLGFFGLARGDDRPLAASAIGVSALAALWTYILVAIVVGIALAVFSVFLAGLG